MQRIGQAAIVHLLTHSLIGDVHHKFAAAHDMGGRYQTPFLLRSENGRMFSSRSYTALVKSYGLRQAFITPYSPEHNGMVERVINPLKDQCFHRHRFEAL